MSDMVCSSKTLDEKAFGRIALKLLIGELVDQQKIPSLEKRRRDAPNMAKMIGEDPEDVREFFRSITPSIVGRITGCQHVSMENWVDTH